MAAIPSDPAQLAALIKSQNLATLLATMTGNGGLAAGKTVEAKLVALDPDGNATALVNGVKVALVLAGPEARQAALQPGASLTLKLTAPAEPGAPLQATLVGIRPPSTNGAPAPTATGQPAVGTTPQAAASAMAPAAAASTPPPTAATALPAAIALQAGRAVPTPGTPVAPQTAPVSPRAIAGPLLGAALGRQDSLAPLFANLGSLAQGTVALTLPKPLMALVDQILAQRLPAAETRPVTPEALKAAVARSGVFLEARQAAGEAPTPQSDLKAALQSLRDLLKPAVDSTPAARLPLPGEPANQPSQQAKPATPHAAYGQDADTSAPNKLRPAPPRDGLLTPQPATEPSLNSAARPGTIAQTLFGQAEAALDRIALAQYASLPQEAARLDQQPPAARWLTEIPLALPNGTAVLPLEIERDPPQAGSATPDAPLWRVRFALDVEPLGALQGVVTLQGRAIGVSFWAEREDTSRLLRQATPDLETSLLRSRFDSAEFEVFTGHPQQAKAAAGQFLDRRS